MEILCLNTPDYVEKEISSRNLKLSTPKLNLALSSTSLHKVPSNRFCTGALSFVSNGLLSAPSSNALNTLTSPNSLHSTPSYKDMCNPLACRAALMGYGIQREVVKHQIFTPERAATMIQSCYRRYILNYHIRVKENGRINTRHALSEEILQRKGDVPYSELSIKHVLKYRNEIRSFIVKLVHHLFANNIRMTDEMRLIKFFFSCFLNKKDTLEDSEAATLLVDVFCVNGSRSLFVGKKGVFSNTPFNPDKIDFQSFYGWFNKHKGLSAMQISNFRLWKFEKFGNFAIPTYFFDNCVLLRASYFDLVLQLKKYDEVNPGIFNCSICGLTFLKIKDAIRHRIYCKNKNEMCKG